MPRLHGLVVDFFFIFAICHATRPKKKEKKLQFVVVVAFYRVYLLTRFSSFCALCACNVIFLLLFFVVVAMMVCAFWFSSMILNERCNIFSVIYGMKFYEVVIFGLVWLGLVATITVNPRLYFQEIKA